MSPYPSGHSSVSSLRSRFYLGPFLCPFRPPLSEKSFPACWEAQKKAVGRSGSISGHPSAPSPIRFYLRPSLSPHTSQVLSQAIPQSPHSSRSISPSLSLYVPSLHTFYLRPSLSPLTLQVLSQAIRLSPYLAMFYLKPFLSPLTPHVLSQAFPVSKPSGSISLSLSLNLSPYPAWSISGHSSVPSPLRFYLTQAFPQSPHPLGSISGHPSVPSPI